MIYSGNTSHGHDTEPCCCMATNLDMTLSSSMGQDFTKALGGCAGYSHQVIPLHPRVYSSTSLHNTQTVLLLCPSQLSTTYLHIVVAPAAGGPCGWQTSGCLLSPVPRGVVVSGPLGISSQRCLTLVSGYPRRAASALSFLISLLIISHTLLLSDYPSRRRDLWGFWIFSGYLGISTTWHMVGTPKTFIANKTHSWFPTYQY